MDDRPSLDEADTTALHLWWLDHYRATIERKLAGLGTDELRSSRLPSGWSPLELLKHLVFMEQRWLLWGFGGQDIEHPWGDSGDEPDGRWQVGADETLDDLLTQLHERGKVTRQLVGGAHPSTFAAPGGRFGADDRPTLNWILFQVLQEYARHAGQLDVVRELLDGTTGE